MALSGSFTVFNNHPTDTEIITNTVTYPSDLSEDHPYYEKRGTTEIESSSVPVQVPTTYHNQYVIIKGANMSKHTGGYDVVFEWEGYNSKEDSKDLDVSPNFEGNNILSWDWDLQTNIYEESYYILSSSFEISSSIINV